MQNPSASHALRRSDRQATERLFSIWSISLFAFGIVLVLMVLFPKQRIFNQVAQASQASTASTFFLENLLRTTPEDADLRLLLAHHQLELGNISESQQALSVVLNSHAANMWLRAQLLQLQILEIQTFASVEASEARKQGLEQVRKQIDLIVGQSQIEDLEILKRLAQSALTVGHRHVAQAIFEQLGQQSAPHTASWYAKAAKLALGQGDYHKAASLYFSAQQRETKRLKHREYYLAALKTLQAGNLLREAVKEAEVHLGSLKNDEETLFYLVALGRAAGDGAFAQRYVRSLLRVALSHSRQSIRLAGLSQLNDRKSEGFVFAPVVADVWSSGHRRSRSSTDEADLQGRAWFDVAGSPMKAISRKSATIRPFNDRIYQLGYAVFLENRNLADAFSLAQAAVRQVPHHVEWRKRLAQVAEWTGRHALALKQWNEIATRSPSHDAFDQILRLAPGAHDDEQLIFALLGLGKLRSLSVTEQKKLSNAFERVGRPEDAVVYFTHLHNQKPERMMLEDIAKLHQRMGKDMKALQYYEELEARYGGTLDWTMQRAYTLSARGRLQEAYNLLLRAKGQAANQDYEYWKFVGHLAWEFEDDHEAEQAYQQLWNQQQLSIEGQERLIALLIHLKPDEAIKVSMAGWERYHQPKFLLQSLGLLLKEQRVDDLQAVFDQLLPAQEALLAQNPQYWVIRAEVMGKLGKKDEAWQAYEQALAINPRSAEIRQAYLWFLVEQKNVTLLRKYLRLWQEAIESDARLWGPAAAAYVVLDEPERSLPFFVRQLKTQKNDYLWLLNYADALEASSRRAMAWQVRHYAWLGIRKTFFSHDQAAVMSTRLEVYARLVNMKDPGDQLHSLLRHERMNTRAMVMKELVLSWFLSQEAFDSAKAWLWSNYAQRFHGPGWANLALALAENNWAGIDAIVLQQTDDLSLSDKIEAANFLKRHHVAQDLSFESLSNHPDDDDIHFKYQEAIDSAVDQFTSRVLFEERKPISSFVWKTSIPVQIGRLLIKPSTSVTWQESVDAEELTGVPRVDRQVGLSLGYRLSQSTINVSGFHRSAVSNIFGFGLQVEQIWNEQLSSTFTLARNHKADDSIVLLVGGVKDFIRGQGLYYFAKRQFGSLQLESAEFLSQSRDKVGRGYGVEGAIGHHIRKEYPDVTVRVLGTIQRYSRISSVPGSVRRLIPSSQEATPIMVVPESFIQSGINISLGDSIRDLYTKGIRPFGLIGVNYNTVTGIGHSVEAGLAARILGQDRLLVYGSNIRGGFGQNATTTRMNLEYQRWF